MSFDSKIRPLILKGGLAVYESVKSQSKTPTIIVFQYNPEDLKRTLTTRSAKPKSGDVGGAKEDVMRAMGPPVEAITLKIVIDVVDQLSVADRTISEFGIYPQLSVLEMLLYPTLAKAKRIEKEAKSGKVQLTESEQDLPLALLVWGKYRAAPVQLTSFSIAEEAFDANLNPIQATVDLGMNVLTYMEFPSKNLAQDAFIAYQSQKEMLAEKYAASGNGLTDIKEALKENELPIQ